MTTVFQEIFLNRGITGTDSYIISHCQFLHTLNPMTNGSAINLVSTTSSLDVSDSLFVDCHSKDHGGAIYVKDLNKFHLNTTCFYLCFTYYKDNCIGGNTIYTRNVINNPAIVHLSHALECPKTDGGDSVINSDTSIMRLSNWNSSHCYSSTPIGTPLATNYGLLNISYCYESYCYDFSMHETVHSRVSSPPSEYTLEDYLVNTIFFNNTLTVALFHTNRHDLIIKSCAVIRCQAPSVEYLLENSKIQYIDCVGWDTLIETAQIIDKFPTTQYVNVRHYDMGMNICGFTKKMERKRKIIHMFAIMNLI